MSITRVTEGEWDYSAFKTRDVPMVSRQFSVGAESRSKEIVGSGLNRRKRVGPEGGLRRASDIRVWIGFHGARPTRPTVLSRRDHIIPQFETAFDPIKAGFELIHAAMNNRDIRMDASDFTLQAGKMILDWSQSQAGGFEVLVHLKSLSFNLIPKGFQHFQNQILNVIGHFYFPKDDLRTGYHIPEILAVYAAIRKLVKTEEPIIKCSLPSSTGVAQIGLRGLTQSDGS